jgi:hypothetical protein
MIRSIPRWSGGTGVADWLLEAADLPTERGLSDGQPLCGLAEAEVLGDRAERPQVP